LPHPEGPTIETNSCSLIVRLSFASASTGPVSVANVTPTLRNTMAGRASWLAGGTVCTAYWVVSFTKFIRGLSDRNDKPAIAGTISMGHPLLDQSDGAIDHKANQRDQNQCGEQQIGIEIDVAEDHQIAEALV